MANPTKPSGGKKAASGSAKRKKPRSRGLAASNRGDSGADDERIPRFIVGIGASAGGLEALRSLFGALKEEGVTHLSFVVVQHLSPQHRSRLVELIAHATPLKVQELSDGEAPLAGVVYITPPGKDVIAENGRLRLRNPELKIGPKPSVDLFLTSLAESCGETAIGVILSGTGSDGSHGVRAIRAAGGLTISQTIDSAKYDGMPRAARLTGAVDLELGPEAIAAELMRYNGLDRVPRPNGDATAPTEIPDDHATILATLERDTGVDFSSYKQSTIQRRIERRMVANRCDDLADYAALLRAQPAEIRLLFQDILISVTAFFRDPEAYRELRAHLAERIAARTEGGQLRIWVIGCATGEEAYSIAILASELLERAGRRLSVQIFASDLDEPALAIARKGVYSRASFEGVPAALLEKYFTPVEDRLQVRTSLRDWVIFARHNVALDPPFLNLDLISCRNVLIYFDSPLQDQVFETIHYALDRGGLLFLGRSEAAPSTDGRFDTLDKAAKIYRRLEAPGRLPRGVNRSAALAARRDDRSEPARPGPRRPTPSREALADELAGSDLFRTALAGLAPDSILIDEETTIRHVYGSAGSFLNHPAGEATQSLTKLLPTELSLELSTLLHRANRRQEPVQGMPQTLRVGGRSTRHLRLEVTPVGAGSKRLYLVVFREAAAEDAASAERTTRAREAVRGGGGATAQRIAELERELGRVREQLQLVVEERESSNEELQSLNEELQSANEELQSANEELETTNEELQSSNEELTTLNQELNVKSTELQLLNQRLQAIQTAFVYPLLTLDRHRHLIAFNPAARYLLRFSDEDMGAHLRSIATPFDLEEIHRAVDDALTNGKDVRVQWRAAERSFEVQVQLFRGVGLRGPGVGREEVEGAVISFVENTAIVGALDESRLHRQRLSDMLENTPATVTMKDLSGVYVYANQRFARMNGWEPSALLGHTDEELFGPVEGGRIRERDVESIKRKEALESAEVTSQGGRVRHWASSRFPIFDTRGRVQWVCTISLDVTERTQHERELELFQRAIASVGAGIAILAGGRGTDGKAPLRTTFASGQLARKLGATPEQLQGLTFAELAERLRIRDLDGATRDALDAIAAGRDAEGLLLSVDLDYRTDSAVELRATWVGPWDDGNRHLILTVIDVTERVRDSRVIAQQQEELTRFSRFSTLGEISAGIAHEINTPLNVITTKTDLLRKLAQLGRLDERGATKVAEDVDRIVKNISGIVQGLKSIAGKDPDDFVTADLRQLIQDAMKLCQFRLQRLGVRGTFEAPAEAVALDCHPIQISQIVINLVNNAMEAVSRLPDAWVRVELRDRGERVEVAVIDCGPGIAPELAEKVMTPFFTTKDKGTGIGLSLSRTIARRHGGDLHLDRGAPNTTFVLELPKHSAGPGAGEGTVSRDET